MAERSEARLSIAKLIGQGYGRGWYTNCHARYRLFKGARNTKKSYVMIGLEVLCKILTNQLRNIVILRICFCAFVLYLRPIWKQSFNSCAIMG